MTMPLQRVTKPDLRVEQPGGEDIGEGHDLSVFLIYLGRTATNTERREALRRLLLGAIRKLEVNRPHGEIVIDKGGKGAPVRILLSYSESFGAYSALGRKMPEGWDTGKWWPVLVRFILVTKMRELLEKQQRPVGRDE